MIIRLPALLCLVALSMSAAVAHAGDIYRWVDEKGQTQVSDTVPPQYQNRATRVDTTPSELSESQRAEAAARAVREKAALDSSARPRRPNTSGANELAPEHKPGASGLDDQRAQCEQLRRAYAESQSCFSSYGTVTGAIRGEAYQHCIEIPDPSPKCGIPSN